MHKTLFIILVIFYSNFASAFEAILVDPQQEMRAKSLFTLIRCTQCKGQSIKDSNAEIALIIRQNIRKQVEDGKTDEEILDFLEVRYGEGINMNLKFNSKNIILWLLPIVLLLSGGYLTLRKAKLFGV
ncbi:cytochrome c biogenesis protein [endosymbiont of Acanthamoeba sp. UWC8]|uniref:cytochrome c-type biogenesis protein n=1 Tax=endosymbiont of Acanthamoeba sp. UWC8 TaxID=86106 RepID=UPI0004D13313|nr:cytochrome c-type biogenesis protein CcmH [endosymbiont of Acanthamoeba sp. UWC8]AIF81841.1 cytochrome c biogenesis protein [endosymbiont of Acanthamoeba sp. UWC8]